VASRSTGLVAGVRVTYLRAVRKGKRSLPPVIDPEGAHLAALHRLGDFATCRVLELGCGDGRLTLGIADRAASVFALDPDAEEVERARQSLPAELAQRVTYRVASGKEIELEPNSFDLVVFSWSL
jgi:ubiquinone/menaquinone biosynthesis C-methylase UbiE